jgi:hypothetical protein
MAKIQMGTANGAAIGNPAAGDFFFFNDSNNANKYTRRDSSGTDEVFGGGSIGLNVDLDSAEASVTRAVVGGRTEFTITHSLNTLDLETEVFRLSDGRTIGWRIERTGVNVILASRAGTVADGLFRILIKG